MLKRVKAIGLVLSGFLALQQVADAAQDEVPEPFRGYDNSSALAINYDDLSDLLRTVVVDVGPSSRLIAEPVRAATGTRMKQRKNRYSGNEGNRFFYETVCDNEEARQYLRNIQQSLEQLPSETPLERFSRDEQLAYWLNLYNVTVLNQVIAIYPRRNLRTLFRGRNSIFEQDLLTVAGVPLSLNDIQFTILKQNYNSDPLVLYGLYQGVIGGPNIRTAAYNGGTVYNALEENAFRFVNSNRGTFVWSDDDVFRVSSFYHRNRAWFPEFEADLTKHLLEFIEGPEREELRTAAKIKSDIDNWTVTDLGGNQHRIAGSLANNQAAMLDAYRANQRSLNGGTRTAMVIIKQEEVEPEEEVKLEDLERFPVKGAKAEELSRKEDLAPTN
jgi:hypothetical protein